MKRRLLAVVPVLAAACLAAAADAPPNLVLILADDLGYGDVGCYGAQKIRTPHIDRLAREGRLFTDAHTVSAVCTPSRYAIMTGEYPWRKGLWSPVFHRSPLVVDPAATTLPGILRERGYATACIGKWHLGFGTNAPDWNAELKPGPLEIGFDYFYGIPVVSSHPPFVYVENRRVVGLDPADPIRLGGKAPTTELPEKNNAGISGGAAAHALYKDREMGTHLAGKAVDWLRARRAGPFFLYFATPNIHHPFVAHPRFEGTSGCGPYGDYVHELDWMTGEVLRTLDECGAATNTLVIFTSDNGGMLNGGGRTAWDTGHRLNGDLLGFKFGAWEGGHRVPFLARWPGRIAAGSRSDVLIGHVDLLATVAAMLGRPLKPGEGPDSVNVLEALTGRPAKPPRDHLALAPHLRTNLAIRSGPWVYIGARGSGGFGNGLGEIAYTRQVNSDVTAAGRIRPGAPETQLYDLVSDPRQQTNVVRRFPQEAARLAELLEQCKKGATR